MDQLNWKLIGIICSTVIFALTVKYSKPYVNNYAIYFVCLQYITILICCVIITYFKQSYRQKIVPVIPLRCPVDCVKVLTSITSYTTSVKNHRLEAQPLWLDTSQHSAFHSSVSKALHSLVHLKSSALFNHNLNVQVISLGVSL